MPGGFVCSASFKGVAAARRRGRRRRQRPLRKLFSKEQRAFFAEHAPDGHRARRPRVLGPIFVLKLKFVAEGFARKLVAELWLYPDGSRILELSTKCAPSEAFQVAAEARAFLAERGVDSTASRRRRRGRRSSSSRPRVQAADGPARRVDGDDSCRSDEDRVMRDRGDGVRSGARRRGRERPDSGPTPSASSRASSVVGCARALVRARAAPPPPRCSSRGTSFYPRILEDVAAATSSVHINQFGFRPGVVGDEFAEALLAKAAEGVPVRLVVDTPGVRPGAEARARSTSGSPRAASRSASCGRRSSVQPTGPLGRRGREPLERPRARAHRPSEGRDRRRPHGLGRRRRHRGSLPGRSLPRPVRPGHRPGRRAAAARLPRELPLARGTRAERGARRAVPLAGRRRGACASSCTTRRVASGRSPRRSRARSSPPARPSTSSTRTSPTAG